MRSPAAAPPPRTAHTGAVWRVAVLAFEGISPFHLSVPCLVFGEDRRSQGMPPVDFKVVACRPGAIRTSAGFGITVTEGLAALDQADLVIVPSWREPSAAPEPAVNQALQRAHAQGAQVVGLCLGAFALAHAGLLDGRRATTHWHWADELSTRFPSVDVGAEALYVDGGDGIMTSAGTAAALDCCLHLVARRCGASVANRVARRLVVAPHRQGSQAQFIEQPLAESAGDQRMAGTLEWLSHQLGDTHSIESVAAHSAMSRRSFTRHFRAATGTTLTHWLGSQRLERARQLLEGTDDTIESIATSAGFGTAMSLRLHFARTFQLSPTRYRAQFRDRPIT